MAEEQKRFSMGGAPERFGDRSGTTRPYQSAAPLSGPEFDSRTGELKHRISRDEGIRNFFGNPRFEYQTNYENFIEEENYDLPDAFIGKNDRMTQLLISEITKEELWPIYYLFPWKKTKSMSVEWDQWIFNDHMLDRVPEESVPRLLTSHRKQGKTSLCRYGIAFLLEHGFYLTEMGHQHFAMNVQQIKNATVETAAYGALHSGMNCEPYEDPQDKWRSTSARNRVDIDEQFREEIELWACLQKTENGAQIVCDRMRNTLIQRNHKEGNVFVFPQNTRKYLEDKYASMAYALTGFGIGAKFVNPIDKAIQGAAYFESRGFRQGEHNPDDDPTERMQTIGSYNTMNDRAVADIPGRDFHIGELDRIIYNGDTDDWDRISYRDNIRYTGLWIDWRNSDDPELSEIGQKFFSGCETIGDYYASNDSLDYVIETIKDRGADVHAELVEFLNFHQAKLADPLDDEYVNDDMPNTVRFANDNYGKRGTGRGQRRYTVSMDVDDIEYENTDAHIARKVRSNNPVLHGQTFAQSRRNAQSRGHTQHRFHGSGESGFRSTHARTSGHEEGEEEEEEYDDNNKKKGKKTGILSKIKTGIKKLFNGSDKQTANSSHHYPYRNDEENEYENEEDYNYMDEDEYNERQNSQRYGNSSGNDNNSTLSKIQRFIQENVDTKSFSANENEVLQAYIKLVEEVGFDQESTVLESLLDILKKAKQNNLISKNVYHQITSAMPPILLKLDLDRSMKHAAKTAPGKTFLESHYLNSGLNILTEHALVDQDEKSSQWLPAGEDNSNEPVKIVTNLLGNNNSIDLEYRSTAFTLTNDKIVLFDMDSNLDQFIAKQGLLSFQKGSDSTLRNPDRVGKLQFSVALSAVFSCVKKYQESQSENSNDSPIDDLRSIARATLSGQSGPMLKYVNAALALLKLNDDFVLKSQIHLIGLIKKSILLLGALYGVDNERVTGEGGEIVEHLNQLVTAISHAKDGAVDEIGTAGIYTPYSKRTQKIVRSTASRVGRNVGEPDQVLEQGWTAVRNLNIEIASERTAAQSPLIDSFFAFFRAYHELYQIYYARGWINDVNCDAWKVAVRRADAIYNELGNSVRAGNYVNMYLNVLFDEASTNLSPANPPDINTIGDVQNLHAHLKDKLVTVQAVIAHLNTQVPPSIGNIDTVDHQQLYKPAGYSNSFRNRTYYDNIIAFVQTEQAKGVDIKAIAKEAVRTSKGVLNLIDVYALIIIARGGDVAAQAEILNSLPVSQSEKRTIFLQTFVIEAINSGESLDYVKKRISDIQGSYSTANHPEDFQNNDTERKYANPVLANNDPLGALVDSLYAKSTQWRGDIKDLWDRWAALAPASAAQPQSQSSILGRTYPDRSVQVIQVEDPKKAHLKDADIKQLLFALPISASGAWMKLCIKRHFLPLIGALMFRPHQRFVMGSAMHMNGFGEAGNTCYMGADFQLGDNVAQKMHFGNFTLYSKTVIWDNRYITHAKNVYCRDYLGGNGSKIWDPLENSDVEDYRTNNLIRDMFLIAIPINWKTDSFHLDITGKYHPSLCADEEANLNTLFPNAEIYADWWGWRNVKDPMDRSYGSDIAPRFNTLCFQAHEGMYNYGSGDFTRIITEKGHWGDRIYPGCGRVRQGWDKYLKPVNYDGTAVFGLVK